ncbi:S-adenosyl-L-methionine-dependent methyltransferase [Syncephalis plumigaleata]|nr:S-adenosyl-L-methionine-dependent methyltransferase [Syncephalis plumigaleata]
MGNSPSKTNRQRAQSANLIRWPSDNVNGTSSRRSPHMMRSTESVSSSSDTSPSSPKRIWAFWHNITNELGSDSASMDTCPSSGKSLIGMTRSKNGKNTAKWEFIDGKKYLVMQSGRPAVFSCDGEDEQHRLSSVHQVMRYTLRTNCIVPMNDVKRVLDTGCSEGTWILDMATDYPHIRFTGLDIVEQIKERVLPKNCDFQYGDILQGLPFPDSSFDLIHQRFMYVFIPNDAWKGLIAEMARTLRPNGQIHLIERQFETQRPNKIVASLLEAYNMSISKNQVSMAICDRLDQILEESGFVDIDRKSINIPVGEWGGIPGKLMGEAIVSWIQDSREIIVQRSSLTYEEFDTQIACAYDALSDANGYFTIYMYTARKPSGTTKKAKKRRSMPAVM